MKVWVYTIISVVLVSLISLAGVFTLSLKRERLRKITLFLVSFAVGGLFGDTFIHLLPQSFEKLGANLITSLYIIGGILIFFVLEKFIRWRHCHLPTSEGHPHPVVTMNLVGDAAHNFIDGMLIAASFYVGITLGIATTIAIILHEIPQEIGDFGILVYGGLSVKKALLFNLLSSLTAVLGAVIFLLIGVRLQHYALALLPITAGCFIYMAGSDLIPELHQAGEKEGVSSAIRQLIFVLLGVLIMVLLALAG